MSSQESKIIKVSEVKPFTTVEQSYFWAPGANFVKSAIKSTWTEDVDGNTVYGESC